MSQANNQQYPELASELRRLVVNSISEGVKKAIHAAAVDLYKTMEDIEDWLKADYTMSINLLENNDEWFAAQIVQKMSEELDKILTGKVEERNSEPAVEPLNNRRQVKRSFDLDHLSLVGKDEFEDWLTARTGVKFIEAELGYEFHDALLVLSRLTGNHCTKKNCPFGPESIFKKLKTSVDEMEVPSSPQALFYKSVSRSLLPDFKELFSEISNLAFKHGLEYHRQEVSNEDVSASSHRAGSGATSTSDPFMDAVTDSEQHQAERIPRHPSPSSIKEADNVLKSDMVEADSDSDTLPLVDVEESDIQVRNNYDAANTSTQDLNAGSIEQQVPVEARSEQSDLQQAVIQRSVQGQTTTNTQTLDTLSRMNAALSTGGRLSRSDLAQPQQPVSGTHYQPQQLVGAISQLQQLHSSDEVIEKKQLRSWIQSGLSKIPGQPSLQIAQSESELIDVTDRFFEVIVEKIGVSGLLEKWLEKLKLTILKVVLRDKTFFSNAQHPARQMLNKLAKLAANEKTDKKRLEKVLDKFIDRVVEEYDRDENAIENVLAELDQLLERQATAQQRNSDRIARAYEGKQKVASARHQVVHDLSEILNEKSVPVVLMELLDKAGWREHLALVLVRDSKQSETYQEALNVVDLILNWLGEEADEADKWALELEMELEAPSIVELIVKELSIVGLVGYEGVIKRLEDCLFNDADPMLVKVEEYEWPYDKTEREISNLRPDSDQDPNASHWHKRIVSMKVGDWVEILDDDNRPRCLRLAWSGSESFRFVFVDSQGMKDEDVSLDELVELFKHNRASFVDNEDVPLVDQGLHQMVQSVYEELAGQSSCDVLTGLLNRQAFERGLEQCIAGAINNRTHASLLYIDVDKFSLINTSYGHHAGDALLKSIAEIIKGHGVEDAFCGRIGGNEFGLILPRCSIETTKDLAQTLSEAVTNMQFHWEDSPIHTTVSIGIAEFNIENDSNDSILRKAGIACGLAKEQGRNRIVTFELEEQSKRNEMIHWVQRLDSDLDELLTLRCQEIRPVNIEGGGDNRPHYEILLGVKEDGQILPPGMLIEAAEHYGRMAMVDRWVIHHVLRWMETNSVAVSKASGFSINLSGNSLSDDSFLEFILGQFAASTVPPEMICFEITETAAITNLADATEFIRVLKQTGCKFSLDDFGTGLSSYAYIQKLPVDYIKIDGVFIRNIANNEQDQALVKSINELAHFMGIKTVAEFVENHDILAVLRSIGVDHSQGFGIKKPSLLEDLV